MNRSRKRKKSIKVLLVIGKIFATIGVTVGFLALLCLCAIFVLEKGPSESAKVLFVKSCDETSAMKWVPHIFLKDAEVKKILENSNMAEVDEGVTSDSSKINTDNVTDEIELVNITGSSYKGYMLIVHDPSRIFCGTVESFGKFDGTNVLEITRRYEGCLGGINAGDFLDMGSYSYTALPLGCVISNGEVLFSDNGMDSVYHITGFTSDNKLFIGNVTLRDAVEKYGIRDAVHTVHNTGPFLVMNGEALINEVPDSAIYGGGKNPRSAIGQREDGSIILLAIDGRQADSLGATFKDLAYEMLNQGAVNAVAMDGGTSTQMIWEDKIINHPYNPSGPRRCPTAWLVR